MVDITLTPEFSDAAKKRKRSIVGGLAAVGFAAVVGASGYFYSNQALQSYLNIDTPPQACVQLEDAQETLDILVERRSTGQKPDGSLPYSNGAIKLYQTEGKWLGSSHLLDTAINATEDAVLRLEAHPAVREFEERQRQYGLYNSFSGLAWGLLGGIVAGLGLRRSLGANLEFRKECRAIEGLYKTRERYE